MQLDLTLCGGISPLIPPIAEKTRYTVFGFFEIRHNWTFRHSEPHNSEELRNRHNKHVHKVVADIHDYVGDIQITTKGTFRSHPRISGVLERRNAAG